jgi:hypothetical protein
MTRPVLLLQIAIVRNVSLTHSRDQVRGGREWRRSTEAGAGESNNNTTHVCLCVREHQQGRTQHEISPAAVKADTHKELALFSPAAAAPAPGSEAASTRRTARSTRGSERYKLVSDSLLLLEQRLCTQPSLVTRARSSLLDDEGSEPE